MQGKYVIGWCLECGPAQFFSVRFLHVLLLQLAYRYALPLPSLVAGLRRQCSVWINGIYWNNNDGIETLVEQLEDKSVCDGIDVLPVGCRTRYDTATLRTG